MTRNLGWAEDNLGYRHAKRVTFTMTRAEYNQAPFHTEPPKRVGWYPHWIAKHTDVVSWTYRPVPVTAEIGAMDKAARVLS